MNNKGFMRIVEATIAIFIVAGVLIIFTNSQGVESSSADYTDRARLILDEISKDPELREATLDNDPEEKLSSFVGRKIPENYLLFEIRICEDISSACGKPEYTEGNVWSAERSISSTLDTLGPKKLRLFIWEKTDEN